MPEDETRPLGRSGLRVLPLGMGTNKWGKADRNALRQTYQALIEAGPCLIDTAEVYTGSERAIGDCIRFGGKGAVIASKFAPFPFRTSSPKMMKALDGSLDRLGIKTIDLYLLHYRLPLVDLRTFADGLAEAVKSGRARAVGVSNVGAGTLRRMADLLGKMDVPLAAIEVGYNLLRRKPEKNGVLAACRDLDIALIAYTPLASGKLNTVSRKAEALTSLLARIAREREVSPTQVALNWLMARNSHVIPIPGATSPGHARDNLAARDWHLSPAEFDAIDRASGDSR